MPKFQKKTTIGLKLADTPVSTVGETTQQTTPVSPASIEMKRDDTPSESSSDLAAVLERLNRLENENKQMKEEQEKIRLSDPAAIIKARKERYNGPRKYSFKTINGKPITDLRTVSNLVNRDYVKWGYKVDQKVELTYADGTKEIMDYDSFSQNYQRSEKMFLDSEIVKDGKTRYVFKIDDIEFSVASNVIN